MCAARILLSTAEYNGGLSQLFLCLSGTWRFCLRSFFPRPAQAVYVFVHKQAGSTNAVLVISVHYSTAFTVSVIILCN